jgi:hypothetical protein
MSITFTGGVNILRRTTTLGTIDNPATSAVQLYNNGQTTNGWYYIQTGMMTSSMQVYCNQTDNGGGWMLISYNPSGSNASFVGYPYPNMFSGSAGSFSKQIADTEKLWYSASGSAQCSRVMRMASTASVQPHLASCSIAHSVVYSNPNALDLATGSGTYTLKLSAPLTGSWSAIKGYTFMTASSYPVAAPCDWLYDAANWWTTNGPTNAYPDAPYGRSGNALGTGGWTNRTTNQVYGMLGSATTTTSANTTNFNTFAVYIK